MDSRIFLLSICPKEAHMKSSTKDTVRGTGHEVKGKIKEVVGRKTQNPNLIDEGTGEKAAGKVQKKIADIKRVFNK
jgi:uncharacterized protein YjbJ (UPF0337 family)